MFKIIDIELSLLKIIKLTNVKRVEYRIIHGFPKDPKNILI